MWPAQLQREWIAPCVTAWITSRVPQKSDHTFSSRSLSNSFSSSLSPTRTLLPPSSSPPCFSLLCFPYLAFFIAGASSEVSWVDYPHVLYMPTHVRTHTHTHTHRHTPQLSQWTMPEPSSLFISMRSCGTYNTHSSHTSSSSSPRCTVTQVADCSSWSSIPALLLSDISSVQVSSSSSRKIRWLTRLFTSDGSLWDF